ncbi:MAG TPA: DUF11 domain-containing protein, partial [Anaerolineales bacterium]|nr:DUF11 domain-containing protein [Anaerolineales bacterium]
MYRCFTMSLRWGLFVLILVGMTFPPQQAAHAAATLSVTPITWNVVGLDSNNVNVGPNNFPVGVRVCNGGNLAATGITVNFVWESSDNYISLRSGSADPITFASLAASTCHDFYFEVSVSRDSAAYDHARRYHIQVTATNDGAGGTISVSSPTPREIYVEHLVSQKRNIVSDVKLDGVSIAAGGTMNLLVGSTYTIQLIGSTATNGYEQIESFINFPNTIFRVNSVTTTYTANGGADANVATKLYADGCGWVNDPGSGIYRSCLGTGKYGGDIVVTYDVTIIGGGGTNQTLNTLIYDFSGSSYHYNSDFSSSYRVAVIADPSTCTQQNITRWTFTGDVSTPSTGTGTLTTAGIGGGYINGAAGAGRAASYSNWTTDTSRDPAKYVDFLVPTSGFNAIHFNFADARSSQGPTRLGVYYSIDGITYNQFGSAQTVGTSWANVALDLSSLSGLSNNPTAHFRIYGYSAGGSTGALHLDTITVTGCALPASINLSKTGTVDQTIAAPTDLTNVGDRINYTLVITNNGGGNLTGITLTDTKLASLVCVPVLGGLALPPRQSSTCTGSYPLTQADFDTGSVTNTATARSVQAGPVTASTTQTLTQPAALTLTKSANPITYYAAGQAITYTYTLTNSGDVTLISPYTVADDKVAVVDCPSVGPLDPGASTTCTGTYTILPADISAGSVTNTASATASSGATTVTSNSASATITRVVPPSIEKSFSHDLINLGGVSTLTFTITNPNTTTALSGVAFSDTLPTGVQVAAVPNAGNTNCGTPAFTPVRGDTSLNFSAGIITAGGTCTVSVNVMALTPGSKINTTGNVTATNSGMGNTASATLNVNALVDLSLDKQVNNATPNVGSTVTFTLVVTNDGPSAATGIVVGDIVPGGYTYIGSSIAGGDTRNDTNPSTNGLLWTIDSLPSGTSVNLTYQAQVLGSGTYDNYAEIIDQDQNDSDSMPGNGSTDEDDDDTQIVTVNFVPALTMTKTVTSAGPYLLGSTITYNIVMTNTGDTTLTNVVVSDPKLTSDSNACASVAPNGTCALGGSYIVQQADVDAGSLSNTATVTDDDLCPAAGAGVCSDTVTVPISQNPSMTVAKSSATTSLSAPETVDYSYLVTNTGTVTLTGISLSDDNDNDDMSCPDGALAPGAVMTCTATHTFTQAELDK